MRLVLLALGWSVGLVGAAGFPAAAPVWPWLAAASVLPVLVLWRRLRWPALAVAAVALGGLRFSTAAPSDTLRFYNDLGGLTIEGVVSEAPALADASLQIRVLVETVERGGKRIAVTGAALVRAPVDTQVAPGDRVRATGLLTTARLIGDLDYGEYLARSGISSLMRDASITVIAPHATTGLNAALAQLRAALSSAISRALPAPQAGLLIAILLGDESGITPATADAFAVTGTAHLVAISGFNMLVVSTAVQAVLLRLRTPRRWAAILSVAVILLYTLLVGASPAVLRAALMSSLLVIGQSLRRRTFIASSLAFALLIITALNPRALWDVGFQLSFIAALGIALLSEPFTRAADIAAQRWLPGPLSGPVQRTIAPPLGTTLAAQLAVTPLIALVFGRVSLISPLVNLLVGPVQPALLLSGGAAALLALAPFTPAVVFLPTFLFLSFTLTTVHAFARLPWAEVAWYPGGGAVALFYALFIAGGILVAARPAWLTRLGTTMRSRSVAVAALGAAAALLLLMGARAADWSDHQLHVWFLDMDGDHAVFIRTPNGAHMLIDGGGHPARLLADMGSRMPFDDRTLELWAITQPSLARVRSASRLLDEYTVQQALTNGQAALDPALREALARASQVTALQAGQSIQFSDGVTIEVLHPAAPPEAASGLADEALVLRLTYGEVSMLLTGDLSASGQQAMIDGGYGRSATVLQVPAGGAEGSLAADLLRVAQPQAVVLLSRRDDPAEPAPRTLTLLDSVPFMQTGAGGAVHVWTDGERLWTQQPG
jgi:competence protein ComEC